MPDLNIVVVGFGLFGFLFVFFFSKEREGFRR